MSDHSIEVGDKTVSGILDSPAAPSALYVMAHGAGAGMKHPFMTRASKALAERGIATFRYNFPYMEAGRGSPDRKPILLSTVRAAIEAASSSLPGVPVFAGGKSMGGRMSSEAQAEESIPGLRGLIFFGFPLHPPGATAKAAERAAHLPNVQLPMLFLQGTRDDFADLNLMQSLTTDLGAQATLHIVDGADHSFHMLKGSGRTDDEVLEGLADQVRSWVGEI